MQVSLLSKEFMQMACCLYVGLGSQQDLHLGEEMVIAWCQVGTLRRMVENLPVEELD
jgi:hypothetical protein